MRSRSTILACALSVAILAGVSPAQEPVATARLDQLMVPIHTAPDDPIGGPYGIWAVGPGYKVSFHDGFRFYPVLGPRAPRNLPFGWRTESVSIAGRPLFAPDAKATPKRVGDFRFEYHYPGVVEAYDVRRDGVEQTFTILARPDVIGDVVVTGRIESELVPRVGALGEGSVPAAVGLDTPIDFADADRVGRVRYGRAWAVDAAGNRTDVERRLADGRIQLVLRGAWLARAVFPVTIDPLTSPLQVGSTGPNQVLDLDFDSDTHSAGTRALVYTRTSAADDLDTYGVLLDSTLYALTGFWSDVNAEWDSERPKVAVMDRAFVTWQRNHVIRRGTVSSVQLYHHAIPEKGHSSGHWRTLPARAGFTQRRPDIGAGVTGALVSWQEDYTTSNTHTATTSVRAAWYSADDNTVGESLPVAGGDALDVENAAQKRRSIRFVVYQRRNAGFGRWQVYGRHFDRATQSFGPELHLSAAHGTVDCITPKVGGVFKLACAYVARSSWSKSLATTRIDYPFAVAPTITPGHVLLTVGLFDPLTLDDVSDCGTNSHWNVLYRHGIGAARIDIMRIGSSGAPTETTTVLAGQGRGACVGPYVSLGSPVFYVASATPNSIMSRWFRFSPEAGVEEIGRRCSGRLRAFSSGPPYAGTGDYVLAATGIPTGAPCTLWVASAQGQQTLPGGCTMYLDPVSSMTVQNFAYTPHPFFGHLLTISLPDSPLFIGDLYYQVTYTDPASPGSIFATNALALRVR